MKNLLKRKGIFSIGLIMLLVISLVLPLSGFSKKDNKVTITFWNGFTASDGEILKGIVKDFNTANEGKIEVKMDIMPWDVMYQKLPPSIATKTAPSLVLMSTDTMPQYIQNGSLQVMDDFWSKTNLKESAYSKNTLSLVKNNGKYYGMPMQTNLIYLYWNKDLFKAAGLNPDKPPVTMKQLADYSVKLTNASKNQFGLGLPVKGAPQYWTSFIWNNGGEFYDVKNKKSLFNSSININTLKWLQDLAVNKKVTPKDASGADTDNLFMSGQLGMYINGPWLINGLKKNNINFGITAVPRGTVRQQIISGGIGYVIPSSASEQEKAADYEFIKYWMSDKVLKEWSVKNGFPVWSNTVNKDPQIKNDPIQGSISPLGKLGRNYSQGYENAGLIDSDALWPMMESILTGATKPADAVKKASDRIDAILKNGK